MKASRHLLKYLAKAKKIDTALFEDDAEWDLLNSLCLFGMSEEQLQELEGMARKLT